MSEQPPTSLDAESSQLQKLRARIVQLEEQLGHTEELWRPPGEQLGQTEELWRPPGHFYSPITRRAEIKNDADRIFDRFALPLPGIELNWETQLELFDRVMALEPEIHRELPRKKTEGHRYFSENNFFVYCDALFLSAILRLFETKRVIEVGSGHSSALMLDVDETYLDRSLALSFIEPFPERLLTLIHKGDEQRHRIYQSRVQDVPLQLFDELDAGDILFIDSSHVSKTGSDVNHLFFQVLPRLKKGVLIHLHDIPFPFEYGEDDVYEGRSWNEAYLTRAFLQYNASFEVLLYPAAFACHGPAMGRQLPERCLKPLGPSLWLRRVTE